MDKLLAMDTWLVKTNSWSAGRPDQSMDLTMVKAGKLSDDKTVKFPRWKVSSMDVNVVLEIPGRFRALSAYKLPVISLIPDKSMLSAVPVAMAMLPLNVEHD